MEEHKTTPAAELTQVTGRAMPLPLADRRRLVRQAEKVEAPAPVITDWASI